MDTRNWKLCFLCQTVTADPLIKPSSNTRLKKHPEELDATLQNLVLSVQALIDLGELPKHMAVDDVFAPVGGDGGGRDVADVTNILKCNDILWHKKCKNSVDSQKVIRARSKQRHEPSPAKTRRLSLPQRSQEVNFENDEDRSESVTQETISCLICRKSGGKYLRKAATFDLDTKVRKYAAITMDTALIGKHSSGDLVAINAVYHLQCLTKLHRQAMNIEAAGENINHEASYVHTTRLRYKLLAAVPGLEEVRGPSNRIDLAYDEDISQAVQDMSASDYDS